MMFNPYTGRYEMQTPMPPQFAQQQQYAQPSEQVTRVNGIDGARALQLPPNSSKICVDETNGNRLFLCMTDGAGFKTVRPLHCEFEDVIEKKQEASSMEQRVSAIEEKLKSLEELLK